jgi:hypothetical protein
MLVNVKREGVIELSLTRIQYPLILILYETEELMMKPFVEMVMMIFDRVVVVDK